MSAPAFSQEASCTESGPWWPLGRGLVEGGPSEMRECSVSFEGFISFQKLFYYSYCLFLFFGCATWHVGSQFSNQGLNLHPQQGRVDP